MNSTTTQEGEAFLKRQEDIPDIFVDPYRTKLHKGNALHTAIASEHVYMMDDEGKPDGERILEHLRKYDADYISVTGVSNKSSQAAFIEHERFVMYAFTGTNEISDWLDNINAFSDEKLGGEIHRGFHNAWEDIWPELESIYWAHRRKEKRPVLITGHSLGGAMATVCVQKFILEDWPFTSAYLYGAPRTLDKKTARTFNNECRNKVFRFQNRTDIVTRLPACLLYTSPSPRDRG